MISRQKMTEPLEEKIGIKAMRQRKRADRDI